VSKGSLLLLPLVHLNKLLNNTDELRAVVDEVLGLGGLAADDASEHVHVK